MKQSLRPALARVFKRLHYPFDVMLMCVRWYVAYGLSVRNLEEMNSEPETITIDKRGSNVAALESLNAQRGTPIKIRQNKYLNNIIEQDHRAIKRRTRPMLGFKIFRCARILLGGIELMHMIKKGQMTGTGQTAAEQFYSLAK